MARAVINEEADLYARMARIPNFGDVRAPGNELRRAALDTAIALCRDDVGHESPPSHSGEVQHKITEYGLVHYGSSEHLRRLYDKTTELEQTQADTLRPIAHQRYPADLVGEPVQGRRYNYVNGTPETLSTLRTRDQFGTEISPLEPGVEQTMPVYGGGDADRSGKKYAQVSDTPQLIYGQREQQSKYRDLPSAPMMPDGVTPNYTEIERYHQTPIPARSGTTRVHDGGQGVVGVSPTRHTWKGE